MKLLTAGLVLLKIIAISLLVSTYNGAVTTCSGVTDSATCEAAITANADGSKSKCCFYLRPTGAATSICSDANAGNTLVGVSPELDALRTAGTLYWTCDDPTLQTGHALSKISACLFTLICLNLFAYL